MAQSGAAAGPPPAPKLGSGHHVGSLRRPAASQAFWKAAHHQKDGPEAAGLGASRLAFTGRHNGAWSWRLAPWGPPVGRPVLLGATIGRAARPRANANLSTKLPVAAIERYQALSVLSTPAASARGLATSNRSKQQRLPTHLPRQRRPRLRAPARPGPWHAIQPRQLAAASCHSCAVARAPGLRRRRAATWA